MQSKHWVQEELMNQYCLLLCTPSPNIFCDTLSNIQHKLTSVVLDCFFTEMLSVAVKKNKSNFIVWDLVQWQLQCSIQVIMSIRPKLATRHMAHYRQTRQHPQHRKYITYCTVVRRGSSQKHVWDNMRADRHTNTLITIIKELILLFSISLLCSS